MADRKRKADKKAPSKRGTSLAHLGPGSKHITIENCTAYGSDHLITAEGASEITSKNNKHYASPKRPEGRSKRSKSSASIPELPWKRKLADS